MNFIAFISAFAIKYCRVGTPEEGAKQICFPEMPCLWHSLFASMGGLGILLPKPFGLRHQHFSNWFRSFLAWLLPFFYKELVQNLASQRSLDQFVEKKNIFTILLTHPIQWALLFNNLIPLLISCMREKYFAVENTSYAVEKSRFWYFRTDWHCFTVKSIHVWCHI